METPPAPAPPEERPPKGATKDDAGDLDEGKTAPFGWLSLVIIVTLVVGTWFLVTKLTEQTSLQDCVQSGRRNCAPIDDTGR